MKDQNKKVIAAFDFDGTITKKDTLFDFIQFYHGNYKLIIGLIYLLPNLLSYKLGLIKNGVAKEKLFSHFFKNENSMYFDFKCNQYSERIARMCRIEMLEKINWHLENEHIVVIVSASVKNWIEPWAIENNIGKVISTEIEDSGGYISGRFSTKNCYGEEKVNRLKDIFPERDQYILYAYGDSSGDNELLAFADNSFLISKNDK